MGEGGVHHDFVEVHPPGLEISSQGLRDGACLLYAVANTYKALTGNKVTRDKWNGAVSQLADPTTFLTSVGARHLSDEEVVAVIEGMLRAGYFERRHRHLDRHSNDSINAESSVVVAPNWRWRGPSATRARGYESECIRDPQAHLVDGDVAVVDAEVFRVDRCRHVPGSQHPAKRCRITDLRGGPA
jgi:hypothetical protein